MRSVFTYITAFYLIMTCSITQGQGKVESIVNYCELINRHPGTMSGSLREKELGTFAGNLDGYFRGDSLIKVTNWDAHVSVWQHDFYFEHGVLILASLAKRRPTYDETDRNKMEVVYEDKYFFDKSKIIKKVLIGRRSKRDRKDEEKRLYAEALEYKKLLLAARRKNDS